MSSLGGGAIVLGTKAFLRRKCHLQYSKNSFQLPTGIPAHPFICTNAAVDISSIFSPLPVRVMPLFNMYIEV